MVEENDALKINEITLTLQPAAQLTFDEAINDDILCHIFLYASADMLLVGPQVSKRWQSNITIQDEIFWGPHVMTFWESKVINQPSEKLLIKRVKSLPLRTLKRALNRVDISRCVEKPDFQNMLIARLIFGDRCPVKRESRLYYPEWALRIGIVCGVTLEDQLKKS